MGNSVQEISASEQARAAWAELTAHLERRSMDLAREVRNYPTPIARCDEQLTKLIEQRSLAGDALRRLLDADPQAGRDWRAALSAFLAGPPAAADDETERALRARLQGALSDLTREG
jgi:hypothetical protein